MLLLTLAFPLFAQENTNEPFSFVGMRLDELINRFGVPNAVFVARGGELWQDDVVFQYAAGDFFIHRDRVWKVRLSSAHGLAVGDPRQAAILVLGDNAQDRGDYIVMALPAPAGVWQLMFRVNINNAGRISDIFIFRPGY